MFTQVIRSYFCIVMYIIQVAAIVVPIILTGINIISVPWACYILLMGIPTRNLYKLVGVFADVDEKKILIYNDSLQVESWKKFDFKDLISIKKVLFSQQLQIEFSSGDKFLFQPVRNFGSRRALIGWVNEITRTVE